MPSSARDSAHTESPANTISIILIRKAGVTGMPPRLGHQQHDAGPAFMAKPNQASPKS